MNALTKTITDAVKAFQAMRHGGRPMQFFGLMKRTRFDYRKEVGDGLDSSVVTAPVFFIQRSLPEARLALRQRKRGGKVVELLDHPMLTLIASPNPFYGDIALWAGTILSYLIAGNAYWLIVRNGAGQPVELWYVPHWMIQEQAPEDGSAFLSHYEYRPGNGEIHRLAPEDVVHFRHGIDPRNLRRGLSPLDGVLREIFSDLESSNFVASLLRNMGVPGVVISPKAGAMPTPEDVEATKTWFKQAFGGDNRGGPLVMGAPTDVQPYGFNPQQMNLSEARDVAEERVCACLGIPAAIVGFGAGLQSTKVGATMKELRQLAWHNGILPLGRALADELTRSLLPAFARGQDLTGMQLYWDTDDVPALQEDEDKQVERKLKELAGGAITLYDYRTETGREADDSHKIFLRPISLLEVPEGQPGRTGLPAPADTTGTLPLPGKSRTGDGAKGDDHDHGQASPGARRASPDAIARGEAFVIMLQRQQRGLQAAFEKPLTAFFARLGDAAADTARPLLTGPANGGKASTLRPTAPLHEGKGAKADDELIRAVLEKLGLEEWLAELEQEYGRHYLNVAEAFTEAAEQAGLGTGLPDPVARAIVASGGRRVGLVDLEGQTRQALFDALAEGRAEGEGVNALANRIADMVEGGPWNDGEIRARIIARTETKFAQNISTIERAREGGVDQLMVFDGRLGPGRSLESHMARNGIIVTLAEAAEMALAEHPNGTLSFAPHFEL